MLFKTVCLLLTVLSVTASSRELYALDRGGYVGEFEDLGFDPGDDGSYRSLAESRTVRDDPAFFRVTGNSNSIGINLAFRYGLNGLSMYPYYGWSVAFFDWISELELPRSGNKHVIDGLDTHAIPLCLAGVKYYAARAGTDPVLPFGFSEVEQIRIGDHTDLILKNENALPIGYTYRSWIPREAYDGLSSFDKEEAQLRAVVLEEAPERIGETAPVAGSAVQIPCRISSMEGLTWEDGVLRVERDGAVIGLRFDGLPGAETALRIVDLDLTDGKKTTRSRVTASTEDTSASAFFTADAYTYAHGRHTQSIDLGRSVDGYTEIRLFFPQKGTFRLKDLEVWCRRMDEVPALAAALREEALEGVETDRRSLRGAISVSEDRFLCVALPYMDGWTAYLDGVPVKLFRANTAFMGIEVPAGEHEVELRYRLPGLSAGLAMTCAGLLVVAAYATVSIRRRRCAD